MKTAGGWISKIMEAGTLAGIGVILLAFLLARLGIIPAVGRSGFLLVLSVIVLANFFWWSWVRRMLRAAERDRTGRIWPRRVLASIWTVYCLCMLVPFVLIVVGGRHAWDALPTPVLGWTLIWHLSLATLGGSAVIVVVVRGGIWVVRRGRRTVEQSATDPAPNSAAESQEASALSRRQLLAGAVAATPLIISGTGTLAGHRQEGRFLCREITLHVPRLPERLRGLSITHLSDIHVGRFFRPEHLPRMVDAANAFRSDLVAVTGDLVDHSNDFLPAVQAAFSQLEAPHGRYVVVGNHDLIDDAEELVNFLARREPHFLCDQLERVEVGGEIVQIAGLFWSGQETATSRDPGMAGRARSTLTTGEPGRFTLALAHHPHAFDALAASGADLVLAGHTHGGQLMLTPPSMPLRLGAGNMLFRYIYGEYARGDARLYVSSGVGNWLPLRINAPAEIVKIRLV